MSKGLFFICFVLFSLIPFCDFAQTTTIKISIKENLIYNNDNVIGTYKKIFIDTDLTSIVIYSRAKARVAEATLAKGDDNWSIATPVDQNIMHLKWSNSNGLELLFAFLVEKKYL